MLGATGSSLSFELPRQDAGFVTVTQEVVEDGFDVFGLRATLGEISP